MAYGELYYLGTSFLSLSLSRAWSGLRYINFKEITVPNHCPNRLSLLYTKIQYSVSMVRYISFKIQDMRASHADVLRLVTHKNVCVYQAVDRPLPIEVIDLEYARFQYFWNDKLY